MSTLTKCYIQGSAQSPLGMRLPTQGALFHTSRASSCFILLYSSALSLEMARDNTKNCFHCYEMSIFFVILMEGIEPAILKSGTHFFMQSFPRGCGHFPVGRTMKKNKIKKNQHPPQNSTLNFEPEDWKQSIPVTVLWDITDTDIKLENTLPFQVSKYILEAIVSEPGWLRFLIFTWCMMTKGDNLGIDSMIYSKLKTVIHVCSHCRLGTPVCKFFITLGFSPLPTLHLQLLPCLCVTQSTVPSKGQKPIPPRIMFHSHILCLQGVFSARDLFIRYLSCFNNLMKCL